MEPPILNGILTDFISYSADGMKLQCQAERGLGMVSIDIIREGDVLVKEKAVLWRDEAGCSRQLDTQFANLQPDASTAVMDLFDNKAAVMNMLDPSQNHKTLDGVFETNCYKTMDGASVSRLFLVFSRFNHDCTPNCTYWFDENTLVSTIATIRQINPGEELTVSYGVNAILARTRSRQRYFENWGFECACRACVECDAPSDERREKLDSMLSMFNSRGGPRSINDEPAHETMFGLFLTEKLTLPALQTNIAEKMLKVVMQEIASSSVSREVGLPLALKWFNRVLKYMPLAGGASSDRFNAFQKDFHELGELQHAANAT